MRSIGVILSGCGVYDGSDVYETIPTFPATGQAGTRALCVMPKKLQPAVSKGFYWKSMKQERHVLAGSARLVRSKVLPIDQADTVQPDALIVPGGFGRSHRCSNFATAGNNCVLDEKGQKLTREIYKQDKPIGFMGVAVTLTPGLYQEPGRVAMGTDADYAETIKAMSGMHVPCAADDIVADEAYRVVTTPASLLASSVSQSAEGTGRPVHRVVDMVA